MTPADELYMRRHAYRLSLDDVAAACGISVWAVHKMEHGRHRGSDERLAAVYRYLFAEAPRYEKKFIEQYHLCHGKSTKEPRGAKPAAIIPAAKRKPARAARATRA